MAGITDRIEITGAVIIDAGAIHHPAFLRISIRHLVTIYVRHLICSPTESNHMGSMTSIP